MTLGDFNIDIQFRGVQNTKKIEIELAEWIFPYVVVQIVTRKKIRALAHW